MASYDSESYAYDPNTGETRMGADTIRQDGTVVTSSSPEIEYAYGKKMVATDFMIRLARMD
jgi:hypothetical protein